MPSYLATSNNDAIKTAEQVLLDGTQTIAGVEDVLVDGQSVVRDNVAHINLSGKQDRLTVTEDLTLSGAELGVNKEKIQEKLSAGNNIEIIDNVISAKTVQPNIDSIAVNGTALTPDENKQVNITIDKATIDLANVDNTSDINKPVSTAQQTALDAKLDKVTTATANTQFYAKAPDGSQVMTEIKGGNGVTVGAASDNKSLEVKVGDTINIARGQTLSIGNRIKFDSDGVIVGNDFGGLKITYPPEGSSVLTAFDFDYTGMQSCQMLVYGETGNMALWRKLGIDITWTDCLFDVQAGGPFFTPLNPCYDMAYVPTDATSGTLRDNESWTYLKENPQALRLLFNKEYYNLSDNQHTTGTLVFSHVGYENGQLIVKTITITISTRGWVLTTIKPQNSDDKATAITGEGSDVQYPSTKAVVDYVTDHPCTAYHIELKGASGTLTTDQYNKLLADTNSYILFTSGPVYRLSRASTSANGNMRYQKFVSNVMRYVDITAEGAWTFGSEYVESTGNKVTALNSDSTNVQYPSAKVTYDYGQTIQTNAQTYANTAETNAKAYADTQATTAETNAKAYADSLIGNVNEWLTKIDSGEGV